MTAQHITAPVVPVEKRKHPTLATVSEAAISLGVSEAAVYRFCSIGEIPVRKLGALRRVPWAWIDEFCGVQPAASVEVGGEA